AGERRRLLRGWDFKIIVGRTLGWNLLKSSRFDVARAGSSFVFRGTGFGHGLGLCQAGAHRMASRGVSYREILKQYFPGTNVGESAGARSLAGTSDDRLTSSDTTTGRLQLASSPDGVSIGGVARAFMSFVISSCTSWLSETFLNAEDARKAQRTQRAFLSGSNFYSSTRLTLSSEHFRVSYPARGARGDV